MDLYEKDYSNLIQENNILKKENDLTKHSISRFEQDREFSLASQKAHYENILTKVSSNYSNKTTEFTNSLRDQITSLSTENEQARKKIVLLEHEKKFYVDENKRMKEQPFEKCPTPPNQSQ